MQLKADEKLFTGLGEKMERIITRQITQHNEEINMLCETLFHNGNGYLGVRACLEEGTPEGWDTMRGTYINGFYDVIPMKQAENLCNLVEQKERMLNVADMQTIKLKVCGEAFNLGSGTIIKNSRTLNMDKGYTLRQVVWRSPLGREIGLTVKRMASFEKPTLFTMEYEVKLFNFSGEVEIESWHIADVMNYCTPDDPRVAAESIRNLEVQDMALEDGISTAVSIASRSRLAVCSAVGHRVVGLAEAKLEKAGDARAVFKVRGELSQGERIVLEKYCVLTDSIRYNDVKNAAMKDVNEAVRLGLGYYYRAQKAYLEQFWRNADMKIFGDEAMNNAISFNMYQLLQSAPRDRCCSVPAKGLSGEGYEGHYFWDTEMFILPFFTLTNPDTARALLSFRFNTLDKARENAKLLGHKKGALFPWRTITGRECSGYYPSGTAQYHINGDIAYAVVSYYLATGDMDYLRNEGAEILIETARLWMDVGNYADGRFVINTVTGPDEYTCMVNNNYYTNCCAKYNLLWAVKCAGLLKANGQGEELYSKLNLSDEELHEMQMAADSMFLPYDEKLGINPQDDSFLNKPLWDISSTPKEKFPLLLHYHPLHLYRYQVCKQADTVLAYLLFEDEQPVEVMKRSFEYYEKITTHDSSLSTCVFSMVASRLNMRDKGCFYFGDSAKIDLENTHNNTKYGIHAANMGGSYMAIVYGFAGVRIKENGISIAPFLPPGWDGYEFKIRYRGRQIKISVLKNEARVELVEGNQFAIKIFHKEYNVGKGCPAVASLQEISGAAEMMDSRGGRPYNGFKSCNI